MLVISLLVFVMPVNAQRITEGNYDITIYPEYCNCDRDCNVIGGCITKYADPFYIRLDAESAAEAISDAEKRGYLGACASPSHNGEPIIAKITPDCDAAMNSAKDSAQENEKLLSQASAPASSATTSSTRSSSSIPSPNTKVITIDFANASASKTAAAKGTGDYDSGFLAILFTSGTIILICLFGLIAWIMYLRYKKNDLSSEDIMNILKKI
jgi:hypothetical protein